MVNFPLQFILLMIFLPLLKFALTFFGSLSIVGDKKQNKI